VELWRIGHDRTVNEVAFSPDGEYLATADWGGVTKIVDRSGRDGVRIWALDIDDLLEIARREAGRSLTDEGCRQYLHVDECSQA
jgi:WD40 repeat protein